MLVPDIPMPQTGARKHCTTRDTGRYDRSHARLIPGRKAFGHTAYKSLFDKIVPAWRCWANQRGASWRFSPWSVGKDSTPSTVLIGSRIGGRTHEVAVGSIRIRSNLAASPVNYGR